MKELIAFEPNRVTSIIKVHKSSHFFTTSKFDFAFYLNDYRTDEYLAFKLEKSQQKGGMYSMI
jgi:hypothetical protein